MQLAACATGTTATSKSAICAGWRAIEYSTKKDTAPTVTQIRAHNLFGIRQGCWKQGHLTGKNLPPDANANNGSPL